MLIDFIRAVLLRKGWLRRRYYFFMQPFSALSWLVHYPGGGRFVANVPQFTSSDSTAAQEYYTGRYIFKRDSVSVGPEGPFQVKNPPPEWAHALHSFEWLANLESEGSVLSRVQAATLIADWASQKKQHEHFAFDPKTSINRMMAWLRAGPFILQGAPSQFSHLFYRQLKVEARRIQKFSQRHPNPQIRLLACATLVVFCHSLRNYDWLTARATRLLVYELRNQFNSDGSPKSRNPMELLEVMDTLLALKSVFSQVERPMPDILSDLIRKGVNNLRFLRLNDGNLAHFNGCGETPSGSLLPLLESNLDDTSEPTMPEEMGYAVLAAGSTKLIVDVGKSPPFEFSEKAGAGTLAFELGSGTRMIVINCAQTSRPIEEWQRLIRTTAAHSTLGFENVSSARFSRVRFAGSSFTPMKPGADKIIIERDGPEHLKRIVASHNGYAKSMGYYHERRLVVEEGGALVKGEDRLYQSTKAQIKSLSHVYFVRFHLHPDVVASRTESPNEVLLTCGQEAWLFRSSSHRVMLDESVYFATFRGKRSTSQLVLSARSNEMPEVSWSFSRQ